MGHSWQGRIRPSTLPTLCNGTSNTIHECIGRKDFTLCVRSDRQKQIVLADHVDITSPARGGATRALLGGHDRVLHEARY